MSKLLKRYLPELDTRLTDLHISPAMYCTEWFMCVYTRSFPYDVVVRIWDIFLSEGWVIVYQVALALLALFKGLRCARVLGVEEILGKDFEDAYAVISGINHSVSMMVWTHSKPKLPSADVIISTALRFEITDDELETYRREFARTNMKKIDFSFSVC